MRYSMGLAGALLLAMSTSSFAVDAVRDAGTKVRGEWFGHGPANDHNRQSGHRLSFLQRGSCCRGSRW